MIDVRMTPRSLEGRMKRPRSRADTQTAPSAARITKRDVSLDADTDAENAIQKADAATDECKRNYKALNKKYKLTLGILGGSAALNLVSVGTFAAPFAAECVRKRRTRARAAAT